MSSNYVTSRTTNRAVKSDGHSVDVVECFFFDDSDKAKVDAALTWLDSKRNSGKRVAVYRAILDSKWDNIPEIGVSYDYIAKGNTE
jgi:hypothetical protein